VSTNVRVSVIIDASVETTWASVEEIASHVDWMADAESIRFTTATEKGVGTAFECVTRVGPLRLTDLMSVNEWTPPSFMGVDHRGVVRGTGRFTLEDLQGRRTRLVWEEDLSFPWWLGGLFGGYAAQPILSRLWRGNLKRLKRLVEEEPAASPSPTGSNRGLS